MVYSGLLIQGRFITETSSYNYFKDMTFSVMKGRLDVDCNESNKCHDLISYRGRHYLYWPPVSAFVYIPFVLIWGTSTPDSLINSFLGAVNAFLIIILAGLFAKRFNIFIRERERVFIVLLWSFGTVHFYMSGLGSVWYVSQVMAQTFLLSSLIFILKGTKRKDLVLSGVFFCSCGIYQK